ncbi:MAG: methyltransferase domain-containing protein [Anaerolineae bacterium]|nr:methyltransferase domain-containing protein [Anaerolineae bacterium]
MAQNPLHTNHWQQAYEQTQKMWDERPDPMLVEYAGLIPPGNVLDLGIGEGRNAFFLARNGYEVRGIDIAQTAVERCNTQAARLGLPVTARVGNITEHEIPKGQYALISSTMTLQFMKPSESHIVFERMKAGLAAGGVLYLTIFSTDDPSYARLSQSGEAVEPNTFFAERLGQHIHFFTKAEILDAFADLKLIYIAEQVSYDPGHGGVPEPHYHGIITCMGKHS